MANSTATTYGDDCVLMLKCDGADGSTTFTDVSDSAHTVTANGNAQVDTAQSVFGGASALFDGSGDYLSIPDSDNWDLGTGDFTIDFRVRFNAVTGGRYFFQRGNTDFDCRYTGDGKLNLTLESTQSENSWSPSTSTWYHVAITRASSTVRMFIDGTQIGTNLTNSSDVQGTSELVIGSQLAGTNGFNGWVDEFRIVKGQAIWTANFTPPASAYTADSAGGGLAVLGRRPIRSNYRGVMR